MRIRPASSDSVLSERGSSMPETNEPQVDPVELPKVVTETVQEKDQLTASLFTPAVNILQGLVAFREQAVKLDAGAYTAKLRQVKGGHDCHGTFSIADGTMRVTLFPCAPEPRRQRTKAARKNT